MAGKGTRYFVSGRIRWKSLKLQGRSKTKIKGGLKAQRRNIFKVDDIRDSKFESSVRVLYAIMMPLLIRSLFLLALPIIGVAIFWSSWIQYFTKSVFPAWSESKYVPQVRLLQGLVVGTLLDVEFPAPIEGFMGLSYALPPTGERRFRRAVALPESNNTFEAKKYGLMYESLYFCWAVI